jgi:hypothetical protein
MSKGAPLPEHVKNSIETLWGIAMDDVRVHYNSAKPTQVNARAYTQGNNIYLAPGHSNPHSPAGIKLLGHELCHVVQQKQGRVKPTTGVPIGDDPALNREADAMGEKLLAAAKKA